MPIQTLFPFTFVTKYGTLIEGEITRNETTLHSESIPTNKSLTGCNQKHEPSTKHSLTVLRLTRSFPLTIIRVIPKPHRLSP